MTEVKQAIKEFEGLYEVSNHGNVYSMVQDNSRRKGPLKPYKNKAGYLRVNLYDQQGIVHKRYLHRLVAETFLPHTSGLVVNHIDGNKSNNSVENLEWCTQKENIHHSFINKLEHRSVPVEIDEELFPNMKIASIAIGRKSFTIGTQRRQVGNIFYLDGHLIKCGDAIARN